MSKREQILLVGLALVVALSGGVVLTSNISGSQVDRIADAIAYAEGFYVSGSRPSRNNNPGDLTSSFGLPTLGLDGDFPVFATLDAGWQALKMQISAILNNTSSHYNSDMSIREIGQIYANGDSNWAVNVADRLGVSPDTVISDV